MVTSNDEKTKNSSHNSFESFPIEEAIVDSMTEAARVVDFKLMIWRAEKEAMSGTGGSVSAISGGGASNAIGMNRGGQVQVFQSVPEPETEAALKASQAQALAAQQRAAVAALGKRSDDVISKPLNAQMAFEKFAGKVFDTSRSGTKRETAPSRRL